MRIDSNEYRDHDNGYFYEELKDTSTNADGRKKRMKKNNTNLLNNDGVMKMSKNINIKKNNNDDNNKRIDNKDEHHVNSNLKLDPVECKKHKACRKPNKHVGRCKFIYDA